VFGSGSQFYDIWSFDLTAVPIRAQRLTQGTSWYGPPFLTAGGDTLYYLRADPLGNSLYRDVHGEETAVTAERQVVDMSLRLSPDERTITFESVVDSALVLMIHDVASGISRWVPRSHAGDAGWLLPGGDSILWRIPSTGSLSITDAQGRNRRDILATPAADQSGAFTGSVPSSKWYGTWFLAPDGKSVAVLGGSRDVAVLVRVPLRGGTIATLGRFPVREGDVGLAGWTRDGLIYLARRRPVSGGTTLLRLDAVTGATRSPLELPAACHVNSVSVAREGRRAACTVREQRADVMLIDGLRP
jgi:hypothetical protein